MSDGYEARRTLLHETAIVVGRRWFDTWRAELLGEGRIIEGGWPGTVAEARALVAASIGPMLVQHRLTNVTTEELGWAARTTYAEAKRAWLMSEDRRRGPETDPRSA